MCAARRWLAIYQALHHHSSFHHNPLVAYIHPSATDEVQQHLLPQDLHKPCSIESSALSRPTGACQHALSRHSQPFADKISLYELHSSRCALQKPKPQHIKRNNLRRQSKLFNIPLGARRFHRDLAASWTVPPRAKSVLRKRGPDVSRASRRRL